MNFDEINPGSYILFDPEEKTIRPEEELPEEHEQIVFWPKGSGVAIGGTYMDEAWYQVSVSKNNINYRRFDGIIDFWMRIPQIKIKTDP